MTPNFSLTSDTISLTPQALVVTNSNGNLSSSSITSASFIAPGLTDEGTYTFAQSWDEVGVLQIDTVLNDYLGGGEDVTGQRINIGRFIPDHFTISAPSITVQCGSFTYMGFFDAINPGLDRSGQMFDVSGTITAENSSGNRTRNYAGTFAQMLASDITIQGYDATASSNASGIVNFSSAALNFIEGESNYSDLDVHYQSDLLTDLFDLRLDLNASDSDGVSSPTSSSNAIEVRLGRLRMIDTYGPETDDLEMVLTSEYFNGTGWSINSNDNCTRYVDTDASFDVTSYTDSLNDGETSISAPTAIQLLSNGQSSLFNGLKFSASGDGNYGSVLVEYNLSSQPWLQFDWDGDNSIDTTNASLNFGYYRGSDRVIYWREIRN